MCYELFGGIALKNHAFLLLFFDLSGVLALIRLLLTWDKSGHPHLLVILPDFSHWRLSFHYCYISNSMIRSQFFLVMVAMFLCLLVFPQRASNSQPLLSSGKHHQHCQCLI